MNCNIIKDLLPLYVDGVCSNETYKAVEEHIGQCKACQSHLAMLQQEVTYIPPLPEEVKKAIAPFKKIKRKRYFHMIAAIAITFMVMVIGMMVYQEVGTVHDFFSPIHRGHAMVDSNDNEWYPVEFHDGTGQYIQDYLLFDSIFWSKAIINDANNEHDLLLRIKDEDNQIILDNVEIKHGTSVDLKALKRNIKYFLEIKAPCGKYTINAI
ncbi:anti-sigma factor family protein [Lysinibacillus piscis]|uniref:Anti-sigma-W factor RsiW n=1 Tax=Lysinibacillus piscis TaxID=2518931 RepID=A0ABQ5NMT8_9BACI|nr:zf-HC2 domain-containing protein [Lysinibacillus sp. KH24]GLC89609.1 hypothetical protein LYSBPC_27360 [Lysinibacillus sp. KH24]